MERSQVIELVVMTADLIVEREAGDENQYDKTDGDVVYTPRWQKAFDEYYDEYDAFARKWLEKFPDTTPEYLKRALFNEAGLRMLNPTLAWSDCAVGFYFEGVEEELEGDIVFEPGHYMWNPHSILNWETGESIIDVLYLMEPDDRHKDEEGNLIAPEVWRHCPKGIVVRKLSKEHENGGSRPHFESRSNGYVFIVAEFGEVWISGEEFNFVP
jgi:hypothetical protein